MLRLILKPAFHDASDRLTELKDFLSRNEDISYKELGKLAYHWSLMELDLVRLREARNSVVKRNQKLKTLTEVVDFRNELNDL